MNPVLPPLIALTRPAEANEGLAQLLRTSYPDMPTLNWPLLTISPPLDSGALRAQMAEISAADWLVFVSPRAVHYAHALSPLDQLPARQWAAVGRATAAALQDYAQALDPGIVTPSTTQDSEGLLAALPLARLRGQRVWIVRGETGRGALAAGLKAGGATVQFLPVYRRHCAPPPSDVPRLPTVWVITAPESLDCLRAWADRTMNAGQCQGLLHSGLVVINERTEAKARALGFTGPVIRADAPGDQALARACGDRSLFQAG